VAVVVGQLRFTDLVNQGLRSNPTHFPWDELRHLSTTLPLITEGKEIGGKEDGWLSVACAHDNFNHLPESLAVAALIQYRDVFDEPHAVKWGWRMQNLAVIEDVDQFEVESLLGLHFPGEANFPSERIEEYTPREPGSHR
jgi:hypothetical protein